MFPLLIRITHKIYSTQFLTAINISVSGEESVSEAEPGLIQNTPPAPLKGVFDID